ncbi:MAG: hypothetical protein A2Z06_01365 [Candidatus Glassbacteria bacterium RBG_16_58_8]|uniref:Uncharacterized protein n=1 Tax=Candidatus Glassbacteria bacterium RBG_16_58_8 TaxID=1817866 RepID=A0A1F5YBZ8_9BACT|nr:MAG: hypothetical protein A2Z06_01365 [Candidatus Glassbacteria bacterium RBG_16_58_8]
MMTEERWNNQVEMAKQGVLPTDAKEAVLWADSKIKQLMETTVTIKKVAVRTIGPFGEPEYTVGAKAIEALFDAVSRIFD